MASASSEREALKPLPEPKPQETAADIFNDFAQTTSLLGIQQILRKRSVLWLLAYILCVAMSIFQSWHMTNDFFQMKTSQKFTIQSKEMMPFPSVTVCSNIVLPPNFNFLQVPNFNHSVDKFKEEMCLSKRHKKLWASTVRYNKLQVLLYLRNLTDENRMKLGIDLRKHFIVRCRFANRKCNFDDPNEFSFFNNPYYGNCFTFNPAYEENIAKYADLTDELDMEFELDDGYWLVRSKKPFVGVLVHESGTAPILDLPSVHDVQIGEYVVLTLELREKIFIKRVVQKKPSCVYVTEPEYRRKSRYFSPVTPYLYSLEACMRTCRQNHVGNACQLIDPTMPVQSPDYEAKMLTQLPPIVCSLDQRLTMDACDCPLPCDITTYDMTPDHNELPSADCGEDEEDNTTNTNNTDHSKAERVRVGVNFLSNIYECVEEELQHTLSEFLGFLGGNMSLWIGLCVISLLELFELAWKLARIACKPKWPVAPIHPPTSLTAATGTRPRAPQQLDPESIIAAHFPERKQTAMRRGEEHRPHFRSIYDYTTLRNNAS